MPKKTKFYKIFFTIIIFLSPTLIHAQNMTIIPKANQKTSALNVLNKPLQPCCFDPLTGFFRDGYCHTNFQDSGTHVVCAQVTTEFLEFTKSRGNNLSSPNPQYNFPGLKAGDFWCLCALRWLEAYEAGFAPKIKLESTNIKALEYIDLEILKKFRLKKKSKK
ncbi:MAG: DUF2237 family protein [Rickettsiales bacterium]